ncbi:ribosome-binding ATPase YchF, partial [Tanacetum coccineum]
MATRIVEAFKSTSFPTSTRRISNSVYFQQRTTLSVRRYSSAKLSMSLKARIVCLPNVSKSTLFNAVVENGKAQAANFPFCTIEPNVGIVVRCFEDNDIVYVNGQVDPKSDIDVINLELAFSDLDHVVWITELPIEERAEFLTSLGVDESGLGNLIRATYNLLGLCTYYTSGEKETKAWTIHA